MNLYRGSRRPLQWQSHMEPPPHRAFGPRGWWLGETYLLSIKSGLASFMRGVWGVGLCTHPNIKLSLPLTGPVALKDGGWSETKFIIPPPQRPFGA